jgi:hypothetical protein
VMRLRLRHDSRSLLVAAGASNLRSRIARWLP